MEISFVHPWRPQQASALSAFAASHAESDHNHYLIMPPGAGKTHVGLEIARRIGRKTLVLCPNTAIQSQWLRAWDDVRPAVVTATSDRRLPTQLTVLTYQSVAVFDPDAEEGTPACSARARDAMLDRLHENGRALVERIRGGGPWTLVLDECHHLLETWGRLLLELIDCPHAFAGCSARMPVPPV